MAESPDLRAVYQKALDKLSKRDVPIFCFRFFPDFYRNYSENWSRNDTLLKLVDFAKRWGLLAELEQHLDVWQPLPEELPFQPLFFNVPAMPKNFVGRAELIADLVQQVIGGQTLALAAEGLPGVGKTTMAVALAHRVEVLRHFTDGVLWAGLGRTPDVPGVLADWAMVLGGDVTEYVKDSERSQAVKNLIGQRRLLLVIDDAWEWENARLLRCGGPNCTHVLTTRHKAIAGQFARNDEVVNVPTLEDDPAYVLLQQLAPKACAVDSEAANALTIKVGGLPLAVELLGGYLADPVAPARKYSAKAAQDALAALSVPAQRLQLAAERLGAGGERVSLQETIEWSLEDLTEGKRQVFYSLGAFAPKPATFGWEAAQVVATADDHDLGVLIDRNLLEITDERLTLHQTIADVAVAHLPKGAQTAHAAYYLALANSNPGDWQRIGQNFEQMKWGWQQTADTPDKLDWIWALWLYLHRQGKYQTYLEWGNYGLNICQQNDLRLQEGAILAHIGSVYDSLGQRDKALDYYNRALPITEEVGDRSGLASTLNNIGLVYNSLGQRDKALDYFNRALPIREEVGDRSGLATTLNNIGLVYNSLGQRDKALDYYNRALPITEEVGDRSGLATTLSNIGLVYNRLGQRDKALDYYNRALPIMKEVGDRSGLATTLNNIGLVYNRLGQRDKALDYYNRALPIREEVGDLPGLASTLNNIGSVYNSLGQRDKALDYYNCALPIMEEVGDLPGLATTLNNIGGVYNRLGQRDKALDYYNRALLIMEEVGDRYGLATTLTNIGGVFNRLGQRDKALDYYNRALPIREEVGDRSGLATTLNNIGSVYDSLGQRDKALDYFNRALPIVEEVGDRSGLASTLTNIGSVYNSLGQRDKALDYYNRALPIMEEVGDRSGESITRWWLGLLYEDQDRLAEAREHLMKAVELARFVQSPQLEQLEAALAKVEAELAAQQGLGE